jgi:hypothetical protein
LTDAQVLQLYGCVWAASDTTWIAPAAWAACADRQRVLEEGERVVLGFDGSDRRDATALVACTLDGFVSPIEVWERPEKAPAGWKVDRRDVDDAIAAAMERFEVVELVVDPPGWASEFDRWREMYGEIVVDFPSASRCSSGREGSRPPPLARPCPLEGRLNRPSSVAPSRNSPFSRSTRSCRW